MNDQPLRERLEPDDIMTVREVADFLRVSPIPSTTTRNAGPSPAGRWEGASFSSDHSSKTSSGGRQTHRLPPPAREFSLLGPSRRQRAA